LDMMFLKSDIKMSLIRTSTRRRFMVREEMVELNDNELAIVTGGQDGWGFGTGRGFARGGGMTFQSPLGNGAVGWGATAAFGIGGSIGPSGGVGVGFAASAATSYAVGWPGGAAAGGYGNFNAGGFGAGW
jgi:hypothetical protein